MKYWIKAGLVVAALMGTVPGALAQDQVLRIATEGAFAPYNFTNPDGTLDGFEVDLAKDFCKRMAVKCEIVAQDWDGIIPALDAGKYDAIMASMTITPKRQEAVLFSKPYQQSKLGFAVLEGSGLEALAGTGDVLNIATNPDQFKEMIASWTPLLKGKTIGVQGSTIGVAFLEKYLKDIVQIREYKTTEQHDLDLLAGRIDAIFGAFPTLAATKEKPDFAALKLVGPGMTGGELGNGVAVALRKGDDKRKAAFDKVIDEAIADGTVKALSLKWVKSDLTPTTN